MVVANYLEYPVRDPHFRDALPAGRAPFSLTDLARATRNESLDTLATQCGLALDALSAAEVERVAQARRAPFPRPGVRAASDITEECRGQGGPGSFPRRDVRAADAVPGTGRRICRVRSARSP